jgi:very-short-patch-repair endonuclease
MTDVSRLLRERARELRNNPTDAEKRLWGMLRQFRPRFTRQFVARKSIADLVCRKARLVVEVDGGQHCDSAQDVDRTQILEAAGWRVIRFWNNDVLENTDGVVEVILEAVAARVPEGAHPRPLPEIREGRMRRERRRSA